MMFIAENSFLIFPDNPLWGEYWVLKKREPAHEQVLVTGGYRTGFISLLPYTVQLPGFLS